jgi:hypothetical protein
VTAPEWVILHFTQTIAECSHEQSDLAAISIWVLQHCPEPAGDIARLKRALKPGAKLFVTNNDERAVPTVEAGWANDGLDMKALLGSEFALQASGRPLAEKTSASIATATFWASYQRPGG